MRAQLLSWNEVSGWLADGETPPPQLVFYFGARRDLEDGTRFGELRALFPQSNVVGCSTGGQIRGSEVDDEIAGVALTFDRTTVRIVHEETPDASASYACGRRIAERLAAADLAGIFVLSDGLHVNGSRLVEGIVGVVGRHVPLTGGLAGDGDAFQMTIVGANFPPRSNVVVGIGFYGDAVRIGHGSAGGWDQFGPRRRVTLSSDNVLYELDGEPALDLYERYLGDEAEGLPSTALLFPLRIFDPAKPSDAIVRTVLAVDRQKRSMTFAGDVPEGWTAQLMRGNFDGLAAGAAAAARDARAVAAVKAHTSDELALLVSCIGRRLLMGQSAVDEVEAAAAELGTAAKRIGFYSYGEISPNGRAGACQLHNQTMTITTISEAA